MLMWFFSPGKMSSRLAVAGTAKANDGWRASKDGSAAEEMGSTILRLSKPPPTGKRKVSAVPSNTSVAAATGGYRNRKERRISAVSPLAPRSSGLLTSWLREVPRIRMVTPFLFPDG